MDKQNGNTACADAREKEEAMPSLDDGRVFSMFNADAMARHGRLLGIAGRKLNTAFDVILAIGAMADLVRGSQMEEGKQYGIINSHTEDALLCGISSLSGYLNNELSECAELLNEQLMKGGAA